MKSHLLVFLGCEIALGVVYVIASVLVSSIALFAGLVLMRGA